MPMFGARTRAVSSGGERLVDTEEVSGSNPLSPTIEIPEYEEELGCQPGFLFFGRATGGDPARDAELNCSTFGKEAG